MKRLCLALLLLATSCTSSVILGTLATDGGVSDLSHLSDMPFCSICDQAISPTDIAQQPLDLGDAFFFPLDGGINDLSH